MGACNVYVKIIGRFKTVEDAFNAAVDQARYEHGNDSYNGTISTIIDFKPAVGAPRFGTKAFQKFVERRLYGPNGIEKWSAEYVQMHPAAVKKLKTAYGFGKLSKNLKGFVFFGVAAC